jgi:hypothetical protein
MLIDLDLGASTVHEQMLRLLDTLGRCVFLGPYCPILAMLRVFALTTYGVSVSIKGTLVAVVVWYESSNVLQRQGWIARCQL